MRITVPDGHVAVVMTKNEARDLLALCKIIRGPRRAISKELNGMYSVAGSAIVRLVEAGGLD